MAKLLTSPGAPKLLKGRLSAVLRQKVRDGHYRPGSILESERTIGRQYGVSRFTVRAALQMLEQEGVINRAAGRGAVVTARASQHDADTSNSSAVPASAVFVRVNASAHVATMIAGARRFCSHDGSELIVVDAGGSHDATIRYLDSLPVDINGVILWPFDSPDYAQVICRLRAQNIALVCLEHTIAGTAVPSVEPDAFAGSYKATSHLLEHWPGPVFYLGFPNPSAATARQDGWQSAMADHGFIDAQKYCRYVSDTEGDLVMGPSGYDAIIAAGRSQGLQLLQNEPYPARGWSIFCASDLFALGLYQAAQHKGLEIGRDVRVVGYGNYPFAQRLDPPLTSVEVPHDEIGYVAARLLSQHIAGHPAHPIRHVLPVALRERASSAPQPTRSPITETSPPTARIGLALK